MEKISILGMGWLGKPLATLLLSEGYSVKGSTTKESHLMHRVVNTLVDKMYWIFN
jgi:3-hydroxyisobutyrate dehydrogenase-like beta-hydroxyacid dehydrogenase